jgi:hypothetical protein
MPLSLARCAMTFPTTRAAATLPLPPSTCAPHLFAPSKLQQACGPRHHQSARRECASKCEKPASGTLRVPEIFWRKRMWRRWRRSRFSSSHNWGGSSAIREPSASLFFLAFSLALLTLDQFTLVAQTLALVRLDERRPFTSAAKSPSACLLCEVRVIVAAR